LWLVLAAEPETRKCLLRHQIEEPIMSVTQVRMRLGEDYAQLAPTWISVVGNVLTVVLVVAVATLAFGVLHRFIMCYILRHGICETSRSTGEINRGGLC